MKISDWLHSQVIIITSSGKSLTLNTWIQTSDSRCFVDKTPLRNLAEVLLFEKQDLYQSSASVVLFRAKCIISTCKSNERGKKQNIFLWDAGGAYVSVPPPHIIEAFTAQSNCPPLRTDRRAAAVCRWENLQQLCVVLSWTVTVSSCLILRPPLSQDGLTLSLFSTSWHTLCSSVSHPLSPYLSLRSLKCPLKCLLGFAGLKPFSGGNLSHKTTVLSVSGCKCCFRDVRTPVTTLIMALIMVNCSINLSQTVRTFKANGISISPSFALCLALSSKCKHPQLWWWTWQTHQLNISMLASTPRAC